MAARFDELKKKASDFGQQHIFRFWGELTEKEKENLLNQVENIDFALMSQMKEKYLIKKEHQTAKGILEPIDAIPIPKTEEQFAYAEKAKAVGEQRIAQGKIAALLVAGGQGTRLGFKGPKGKFPIGPVSKISLFQLHAEKLLAVRQKYGVSVPWYIMVSETNRDETIQFFEENNYFDLPEDEVIFFVQGMIPAMDAEGKFFLDRKDHVFTNPNGHGGTLFALRDSGCLDDMKKRGIEDIFYFQVDNVLLKMCDPVFIGYHHLQNSDMSCKVVEKRSPDEKVGVIGKRDGKATVIEYSDMPDEDKQARDSSGKLKYRNGSIAIHVIRREFIEKLTSDKISFPYHVAHKKISYLDADGNLIVPQKENGYKFEMFIFDALPFAKNPVVMEVKREDEFSPVKNKEGNENTPETARRDLVNFYARLLKQIGVNVPFDEKGNSKLKIEISPLFAMTPQELKLKLNDIFANAKELYLK